MVLVGNRLDAIADVRNIAAESFKKTKQNLLISFGFNGIGVPLAITGFVQPTWAMIAMVTSVSLVLANSFAARITSGLATDIFSFLSRSGSSTIGKLVPSELRRWAFSPRAGALLTIVTLAFAVGAVFVVSFGAPLI